MEIILKDNYVITSDSYQFMLSNITPDKAYEGGYKRFKDENGNLSSLIRKNVTYHANLGSLIIELKNRKLKSADIYTLEELGKTIYNINVDIDKMMCNIWGEEK